jgi:hypothetical protein
LSAEEELKVAVAQGAQGGGPFRQARRFPSRFFSRGGIWRRSHAFRTFSHLGDDGNRQKDKTLNHWVIKSLIQ